jgi:hypothetical protein
VPANQPGEAEAIEPAAPGSEDGSTLPIAVIAVAAALAAVAVLLRTGLRRG